jgi:hypothetical protein
MVFGKRTKKRSAQHVDKILIITTLMIDRRIPVLPPIVHLSLNTAVQETGEEGTGCITMIPTGFDIDIGLKCLILSTSFLPRSIAGLLTILLLRSVKL